MFDSYGWEGHAAIDRAREFDAELNWAQVLST